MNNATDIKNGWALRGECLLIWRSKLVLSALLVLFLFSCIAVISGIDTIETQRQTIASARALQQQEIERNADHYDKPEGSGYAAYYTFFPTWSEPAPLAFMALGQRDIYPWLLRIRALGLQAQLYDSEASNPEIMLPGRFDFAFVLVYFTPLVIIALLHDLLSGEREAGRLSLLQSLPGNIGGIAWRRLWLRMMILLSIVIAPFSAGAFYTDAPLIDSLIAMSAIVLYILFWFGIGGLIAARQKRSSISALQLSGCWLLLTLVFPALAQLYIQHRVPVEHGMEFTLKHRDMVHRAWDIPKQETLDRFSQRYPRWSSQLTMKPAFQWDWYFVMHRVADDAIATDINAHREALNARMRWTQYAGYFLPGVGVQLLLERIAQTDMIAHHRYQAAIAEFHDELFQNFLPRLIEDRPFSAYDFHQLPVFQPAGHSRALLQSTYIFLLLASAISIVAALKTYRAMTRGKSSDESGDRLKRKVLSTE